MGSSRLMWVDGVWLVLLAFGYVVLRREVAILDLRTRLYGGSVPDGLDVGVAAPRLASVSGSKLFIFLFGDCGSCYDLVADLRKVAVRTGLAVVVRDGSRPQAADSLLRQVPTDVTTYTGVTAERLVDSFKVHSGPLGISVRDGIVVAKGYLRHADDVRRLVAGKVLSDGDRV